FDIKKEKKGYIKERKNWDCKPDMIVDFRKLPFKEKKFKLITWDPPHLKGKVLSGYMMKKYGNLNPETWQQDLKKGFEEWKKGKLVIFLIPARTDTKRFHDYILPLHKRGHCDIRFIKGRLKFSDHKNPAPFPSMVCILKPIKKVKVKK
ncbi:hypothetical protein LCGC14_2392390, partial [marine sediment metagenome]